MLLTCDYVVRQGRDKYNKKSFQAKVFNDVSFADERNKINATEVG